MATKEKKKKNFRNTLYENKKQSSIGFPRPREKFFLDSFWIIDSTLLFATFERATEKRLIYVDLGRGISIDS